MGHTVMSLLIIHASPTVIIHAILTVMSLLIILASPTVIIHAILTVMSLLIIHASQSTISHNQLIKLSSSYISLINFLQIQSQSTTSPPHHNETFYQLLSNYILM